jgi:hypothetical protein
LFIKSFARANSVFGGIRRFCAVHSSRHCLLNKQQSAGGNDAASFDVHDLSLVVGGCLGAQGKGWVRNLEALASEKSTSGR